MGKMIQMFHVPPTSNTSLQVVGVRILTSPNKKRFDHYNLRLPNFAPRKTPRFQPRDGLHSNNKLFDAATKAAKERTPEATGGVFSWLIWTILELGTVIYCWIWTFLPRVIKFYSPKIILWSLGRDPGKWWRGLEFETGFRIVVGIHFWTKKWIWPGRMGDDHQKMGDHALGKGGVIISGFDSTKNGETCRCDEEHSVRWDLKKTKAALLDPPMAGPCYSTNAEKP